MNALLSRRALLAAGGGLVVSFSLRGASAAEQGGTPPPATTTPLPGSLKETPLLDAWIRVGSEGRITVFTGKAELGQGLKTALLQVAAEQLDVPTGDIELVTADTAATPNEGFTAGSHSMQDSGTAIMNAAAQVRALLRDAAAATFGVAAETLVTAGGVVRAPDGRSLGYGPLAAKLALHVQAQPTSPLKDPATYQVMGTPVPRVDIPAKVTGAAAYVQDLRLPNMLHARAVRQPSVGAKLLDFDAGPVERMPGVVRVVREGSYLAVVAETEWQAIKAMRALAAAARWQETASLPNEASVLDTLRALPARDIPVLNWSAPAEPPVKRLTARYTRPYLMHGAIGPSCALARLADGVMTVWTHTQGVFPLRGALAQLLGLPSEAVRCIHVEGSGCYGHNGADDVAGDAVLIARAVPGRPIRVQWMREQEHTSEPYGPAMIAEVAGAIDRDGSIVDWNYEVWSNTHNRRPNVGGLMLQNAALPNALPVPPPAPIPMPEGGGDRNSNPIYALPNARVVSHFIPRMPLRVSALRSLGAYLNVFAIESFMDELAQAAGVNPVAFRLRHLTDERAKTVIETAAAKFGWPNAPPRSTEEGRGFAFARYKNLGAYCAVALTLRVEHETGQIRLGRIVAAVDSGQPINPDGIRNQIEGAIVQSASWTLYEMVRFDQERITSTDWSGYPIMRFPAVPESVEVHIVPRPGQPFLGTGEAGQGPTAAAIANAVRDATGARLRDLPLSAARVKAAVGV
ncbi:molybdopterin cofactor-binding domain-containing protein [Rhodopila sp.]|uniref:xanthine dehydrogenase family protein molybdopterin-binding subunit n=1 Tax=Rhodopila sp. TaxID=2480087 RepID=UPI003D138D8E